MDLIHADSARAEIGPVDNFEKLDASMKLGGVLEDNSWQLIMDDQFWGESPILKGHHLYIPQTEWGGMVDVIRHSTAEHTMTLTGATWRGMLARKVIEPPPGEAYFVIDQMEANEAIATIIGNAFGALFDFSGIDTGVSVSGQFRYRTMLLALESMLETAGLRLTCTYEPQVKKVLVGAARIVDHSDRIDLSQDYGINLISKQGRMDAYNHIIALGRGELTEREVLHIYRAEDGRITEDVPEDWDAALEQVLIYDYSSVESVEDLREGAIEKAKEYAAAKSVEIDTSEIDITLELGDIVGARDRLTGMAATATVSEKILVINDKGVSISTMTKDRGWTEEA